MAITLRTLDHGDVVLSDAFHLKALPLGGTLLDYAGDGASTDLSVSGGVVAVANGGTGRSTLTPGALLYASGTNSTGQLGPATAGKVVISVGAAPAYSAWTLPASVPKGSVLYGSAAEQVSALPIGATGTFFKSNGVTPAWAALSAGDLSSGTLAWARMPGVGGTWAMSGSTVLLQGLLDMHPAGVAPVLRLTSDGVVGGAGFANELRFLDGTANAGSFSGVFSGGAASRAMQFSAKTDRDGNRLYMQFLVHNGSGVSTEAARFFGGADAGKVWIQQLGVNLPTSGGVPAVPASILHVVETSAGAVPETVRLGNQSTTSGSGTEIGFHASSSGAQKYASVQAVTEAASAARGALVLLTQRASSGGPVEAMRCDGKGNVSIGTAALATSATDGFLYIPTSAGAPTGAWTAKTGLVPVEWDSTNKRLMVGDTTWQSIAPSKAKRLTADVALGASTTVSLTDFDFAIGANETWVVEYHLAVTTSGGTAGVAPKFTAIASMAGQFVCEGHTSTSATFVTGTSSTALSTAYPTAFATAAALTAVVVRVFATIRTGATAGTVNLGLVTGASAAGNVLLDSHMRAMRIA